MPRELSDLELRAEQERRARLREETDEWNKSTSYDPLWTVRLLNPAADMRGTMACAVSAPTPAEAALEALRRFPALEAQDVCSVEPLPVPARRRNPFSAMIRTRRPPAP